MQLLLQATRERILARYENNLANYLFTQLLPLCPNLRGVSVGLEAKARLESTVPATVHRLDYNLRKVNQQLHLIVSWSVAPSLSEVLAVEGFLKKFR